MLKQGILEPLFQKREMQNTGKINHIENVEIRKCLKTDIEKVAKFYDRIVLWLTAHINYPRWIYGVYPGEHSVRAMTESGDQYFCVSGETVLAAFSLNDDPQGNYQKGRWSRELADGSYMVIHALAVDPEAQGHGAGTRIIRFCVEKARSEGYEAVRVDIVPGNIPARALFEKNGFTYTGDEDLERDIGDVSAFSLYELNL